MISAEAKGFSELADFFKSDIIPEYASKAVAGTSYDFAKYLDRVFPDYFNDITGETRGSIGAYRFKSKKLPTYAVKAGVGIPGNLNYLMGLYRGRARTRTGNSFDYARRRDLLGDGAKAYGIERKLKERGELVFGRLFKEIGGGA